MRTLLITSRVTFAPRNYDAFVLAMAGDPHLAGLIVLDNLSVDLWVKAALLYSASARAVGRQLARNLARWRLHERARRDAFERRGKGVWVLRSMNEPRALELVRRERCELLVNARTRCLFGDEILAAPRLGCLNLHHGLLPDQRGVMCDLWALAHGQPAGFSIHRMTAAIDGGALLHVEEVAASAPDYLAYLGRSAVREAEVLSDLLAEIARTDSVSGTPNRRTQRTVYRRNPTFRELRSWRARGVEL